MSTLTQEIIAVTKLAFVADAYPYKDGKTIVVVLHPSFRDSLPLNRSVLKFQASTFTVGAVVEAYEQEVVQFLAKTLRTAELLLTKSVPSKITSVATLCLN